jgi:hypothetical protein
MLNNQIKVVAIVRDVVLLNAKGVLVSIKEGSSIYALLNVVLCIVLKYSLL